MIRYSKTNWWPMSWQQYSTIVKRINKTLTPTQIREAYIREQNEYAALLMMGYFPKKTSQVTPAVCGGGVEEEIISTSDYCDDYCDDYVE